jgi:hypothetical protein
MSVRRQVSYQWRPREVMAAHGLFNASDLVPLLAERGITLSAVQVWRLVTQTPERLSLPVLAALCDIFEVHPAQLIATRAENAAPAKKAAASGDANVATWPRSDPSGRGCAPSRDAARAGTGDLPPLRHHPARLANAPTGLHEVPGHRTAGTGARRRHRRIKPACNRWPPR